MPKFASQRLIFGAVVKIFRGEAESGLEILMRFLVEISAYWSKLLPREGWGARFGRWTLFKIFWLQNWVFTLLRVRKY